MAKRGGRHDAFHERSAELRLQADGHEFSIQEGLTQSVTQLGERSYRILTKLNGHLVTDQQCSVSADEKTLLIDETDTLADGRTVSGRAGYRRASRGRGLIGTWQSEAKTPIAPNTLTIQTDPQDAVSFTFSRSNLTVHAKWDGKDYPETGTGVPAGTTFALEETGEDGFRVVYKNRSRVFETDQYVMGRRGDVLFSRGYNARGEVFFWYAWNKQRPAQ